MNREYAGRVIGIFQTPVNRKKIVDIENLGGEIFKLPTYLIARLDDETDVIGNAKNLGEFRWVFFSDIYSVDVFMEIMEENEIDPFVLDDLIICSFGEAVVDRLRLFQVHSDVVPSRMSKESVVETIRNYVSEIDELDSALFLGEVGRVERSAEVLGQFFENSVELGIYYRDRESNLETAKINTLLKGGAIDEIMLCSEEDILSLLFIVGAENAAEFLSGITLSTSDARVFQSLRENELKSRFDPPEKNGIGSKLA